MQTKIQETELPLLLSLLQNLPALTDLNLDSSVENVEESFFLLLPQTCVKLKSLNVGHSKISDAGVVHILTTCKDLEILNISATKVTDNLAAGLQNKEYAKVVKTQYFHLLYSADRVVLEGM
jgi:hypothetical protein